ncbi:hypothetical protein B9T36_16110 [Acinetobacter sp. ANC 4204]|uniref:hypothetical protein n=1 Tax=Acinetobacter sp. TUM15064 TaxID=2609134 RepID=UPI000A333189|nr:hypothetical protein [Acinetobacter sp. TUM15064]OTG56897.1 hypothetical protein B9T36_16110 [Acinetobacter sp. ANC 4204]
MLAEAKVNKREWHGTHHSWSYHPQAFRWSGEMISGINILPIATEMRAWMMQRGLLSLMPPEEPSNKGGFTNPYTTSGITLSLLMSRIINCSHDFTSNPDCNLDEVDSEIERLRLNNEILLYSARLCEVAIKQLLYCTQIPEKRYKKMALGQLLESPCPSCKRANGKEPHLVSLVGTLAHPYHLCFEFEHCAMDHMNIVNKLRNSNSAHSDIEGLNIRTPSISRSQHFQQSTEILSDVAHMLSHIEHLEQKMISDLQAKGNAINRLKLDGLKAEDCNFNLVPCVDFNFHSPKHA